jgi:hypothetical protein
MAYTANSTISEIMQHPNASAIFEKHSGMKINPAQLQMAMGMSLQQVAGFVGWGPDKIEAIIKDLNA